MDDTNEPDTIHEHRDIYGLVENYYSRCARLLPDGIKCNAPASNKAFVATGDTVLCVSGGPAITIPEYLVVPLCSVHIEEEAEPLV